MENVELKDRFIDEKTGIEYIRNGDYYLPNLVLVEQKKIQLNKYSRLRLKYLKNHKKAEYSILFMDNKLTDHLEEVKEKFYYELHHQEDIFSDKEVAKICELIEKKSLVFSKF